MNRIYRLLLSYTLILYVGLFCLVGLVGYVSYRIAAESTVATSAGAWLVDRAGRQRMLAQRFAKELLLLQASKDEGGRERWRTAALETANALVLGHAAVRENRHPVSIESPAHKAADQYFHDLEPLVQTLATLRPALQASGTTGPSGSPAWDTLLAQVEGYVVLMDKAVALLVEESRETTTQLRQLIVWVAGPMLAVLLVLTLAVFWPLVRRAQADHAALQQTNVRLQATLRHLQQLATVVEQSADGILICDPQARIVYVNPTFETLSGWPAAEVIGRTPGFLRSGRTPDATYVEMWRTLKTGRPWHGHVTDKRRDGSLFEADLIISPIFDGEQLQGYAGATRDVTREQELEVQLRQAQKLEAIGALAGGIAHDFNNILTPIMGYTELALHKMPAGSPDRTGLERVLTGARRARDLVRQILAFSRQTDQAREPVPMHALLEEVSQLLQGTTPANVNIQVEAEAGLDPVPGNPSQLHTVVLNLCVNAVQAMPQGGQLTLALAKAKPTEEGAPVALGPNAGLLRLTVRDTGVGMEAGTQERMFDPFFTTKPVGQGTGLGLSAVYGIVTQHGGSVRVESSPGAGTTAIVYLPTQAMAGSIARPAFAAPAKPAHARILLVDDQRDIAELAREALAGDGHAVHLAGDGAEAWTEFQRAQDHYDLVITDLTMPNLSGRELLERLQAVRPGLPVILVSGYETPGKQPPPRPGYAVPRFLAKPYSIDALRRIVQEELAR